MVCENSIECAQSYRRTNKIAVICVRVDLICLLLEEKVDRVSETDVV